jgi:hypothetical protein
MISKKKDNSSCIRLNNNYIHTWREDTGWVFLTIVLQYPLRKIRGGYFLIMPVPVAARSKARVWGRSLAGVAGSHSAEGMDMCLLWVLWVIRKRFLRRADSSSRGFLPNVVFLYVISKLQQCGGLGPRGATEPKKKFLNSSHMLGGRYKLNSP